MTDKLEHSPLPWRVDPTAWADIQADGPIEIATTAEEVLCGGVKPSRDHQRANAAFIVRAVNSHYKLIEALEISRAALMAVADAAVESGFHQLGDVIDTHLGVVNRVIDEARGE